MSQLCRLGQRLRGSRIDDRRPTPIWASPETGHFRPATTPVPSRAGLAAIPPPAALLRTLALMR
jgi:hypothetical protein